MTSDQNLASNILRVASRTVGNPLPEGSIDIITELADKLMSIEAIDEVERALVARRNDPGPLDGALSVLSARRAEILKA